MSHQPTLSDMKIAIIDDHDLLREGINAILSNHGVGHVAKFGNGTSLIETIDSGKDFDFYIIDIELPDIDGFELIDLIKKHEPKAKIIISTVHDEIWTLHKLIARDVDAIVYKSCDGNEITTALQEVLNGNRYYCQAVQKALGYVDDSTQHPSERELEVLRHIARGKTSREIAAIMYVTENTVEAHRKGLLKKLGAVNVADLIVKAMEKGYLTFNADNRNLIT